MKKIITFTILLSLALLFSSCGNSDNDNSENQEISTTTTKEKQEDTEQEQIVEEEEVPVDLLVELYNSIYNANLIVNQLGYDIFITWTVCNDNEYITPDILAYETSLTIEEIYDGASMLLLYLGTDASDFSEDEFKALVNLLIFTSGDNLATDCGAIVFCSHIKNGNISTALGLLEYADEILETLHTNYPNDTSYESYELFYDTVDTTLENMLDPDLGYYDNYDDFVDMLNKHNENVKKQAKMNAIEYDR